MAAPRTIASNAAPAGRKSQTETIGTTRPELHVIKGTRVEGNGIRHGFEQLITWTRTRSTPLLHLVIAAVFLGVCLLGSLCCVPKWCRIPSRRAKPKRISPS